VVRQFTDDVAAQLRTVSPSYEVGNKRNSCLGSLKWWCARPKMISPPVNLADREKWLRSWLRWKLSVVIACLA